MDNEMLRRSAEQYVETQLNTLAARGSRVEISNDVREDLINSAMRAAGYRNDEGAE
jgi:hypothetical protein